MGENELPSFSLSEKTRLEFERLLSSEPLTSHYELVLYVSGNTLRSAQAVANIRNLCEEHLGGRYELEVVDIYQTPERLSNDQIIAAPTLLKRKPEPSQRLVGNLADPDRVLIGLNLKTESNTTWVQI